MSDEFVEEEVKASEVADVVRRRLKSIVSDSIIVVLPPEEVRIHSIGQAIRIATSIPLPYQIDGDVTVFDGPLPYSFTFTAYADSASETIKLSVYPSGLYKIDQDVWTFNETTNVYGTFRPVTISLIGAAMGDGVITLLFSDSNSNLIDTETVTYTPGARSETTPAYPRKLALDRVTKEGAWFRYWLTSKPGVEMKLTLTYWDDNGIDVTSKFEKGVEPVPVKIDQLTGRFLVKEKQDSTLKFVTIIAKRQGVTTTRTISAKIRVELD